MSYTFISLCPYVFFSSCHDFLFKHSTLSIEAFLQHAVQASPAGLASFTGGGGGLGAPAGLASFIQRRRRSGSSCWAGFIHSFRGGGLGAPAGLGSFRGGGGGGLGATPETSVWA